jgi:hypothetical protein
MTGHGLFDILVQFIEGTALGEYVFLDTTRAPAVAIEIILNLYQHIRLRLIGLYNII